MNKKIMIICVISLLLDQISKILIDVILDVNEVVINNFFSITRVSNTGAAFSILKDSTSFLCVLSVICLFVLKTVIKEFPDNKCTTLAFGLLFGGIFGNLIDRLFLGSVRDFLSFASFPIFNIADSCIVVGVILLIIDLIVGEVHERKNRQISK